MMKVGVIFCYAFIMIDAQTQDCFDGTYFTEQICCFEGDGIDNGGHSLCWHGGFTFDSCCADAKVAYERSKSDDAADEENALTQRGSEVNVALLDVASSSELRLDSALNQVSSSDVVVVGAETNWTAMCWDLGGPESGLDWKRFHCCSGENGYVFGGNESLCFDDDFTFDRCCRHLVIDRPHAVLEELKEPNTKECFPANSSSPYSAAFCCAPIYVGNQRCFHSEMTEMDCCKDFWREILSETESEFETPAHLVNDSDCWEQYTQAPELVIKYSGNLNNNRPPWFDGHTWDSYEEKLGRAIVPEDRLEISVGSPEACVAAGGQFRFVTYRPNILHITTTGVCLPRTCSRQAAAHLIDDYFYYLVANYERTGAAIFKSLRMESFAEIGQSELDWKRSNFFKAEEGTQPQIRTYSRPYEPFFHALRRAVHDPIVAITILLAFLPVVIGTLLHVVFRRPNKICIVTHLNTLLSCSSSSSGGDGGSGDRQRRRQQRAVVPDVLRTISVLSILLHHLWGRMELRETLELNAFLYSLWLSMGHVANLVLFYLVGHFVMQKFESCGYIGFDVLIRKWGRQLPLIAISAVKEDVVLPYLTQWANLYVTASGFPFQQLSKFIVVPADWRSCEQRQLLGVPYSLFPVNPDGYCFDTWPYSFELCAFYFIFALLGLATFLNGAYFRNNSNEGAATFFNISGDGHHFVMRFIVLPTAFAVFAFDSMSNEHSVPFLPVDQNFSSMVLCPLWAMAFSFYSVKPSNYPWAWFVCYIVLAIVSTYYLCFWPVSNFWSLDKINDYPRGGFQRYLLHLWKTHPHGIWAWQRVLAFLVYYGLRVILFFAVHGWIHRELNSNAATRKQAAKLQTSKRVNLGFVTDRFAVISKIFCEKFSIISWSTIVTHHSVNYIFTELALRQLWVSSLYLVPFQLLVGAFTWVEEKSHKENFRVLREMRIFVKV